MSISDRLYKTLEVHGASQYGSEDVSQLEHALQCALQAEEEGATEALITAALLHDIGHLVHKLGVAAERGIDDLHETLGEKLLRRHFKEDVVLPVALHVDAKRYLCFAEASYFDTLSFASVRSLELQGGRFDQDEADCFIQKPGSKDAVRLRRWDDRAKIAGKTTPDLRHFWDYVEGSINA
ncbi:MAG: HD domain-containing protein [Alphaproteobacteria bacterium]|nr:HD domain-containing protein [Alphaproteobacteria bacterium]